MLKQEWVLKKQVTWGRVQLAREKWAWRGRGCLWGRRHQGPPAAAAAAGGTASAVFVVTDADALIVRLDSVEGGVAAAAPRIAVPTQWVVPTNHKTPLCSPSACAAQSSVSKKRDMHMSRN